MSWIWLNTMLWFNVIFILIQTKNSEKLVFSTASIDWRVPSDLVNRLIHPGVLKKLIFQAMNWFTDTLWFCESINTVQKGKNLQFFNCYGSAFEFDWGMESYYFLTFENIRLCLNWPWKDFTECLQLIIVILFDA
jgi:hypothetical protein